MSNRAKKEKVEIHSPAELTVDRQEFNRNLQKLIHAKPLPQEKIRIAKRKPAKIIQPK